MQTKIRSLKLACFIGASIVISSEIGVRRLQGEEQHAAKTLEPLKTRAKEREVSEQPTSAAQYKSSGDTESMVYGEPSD